MVDTNIEVPAYQFVFLAPGDLLSVMDSTCPDCGRRVLNGIKKLGDGPILYYAKCVHEGCDFDLEVAAEDYTETFEAYYGVPWSVD